jgi:hypothetical protein
MTDVWSERTRLWQTSPSSPTDRCDLVLVRSSGSVLLAVVVDGAPGKVTARPPRPREALFAAVGEAFLDEDDPVRLISEIGVRLQRSFSHDAARLYAAAAAVRWDAADGSLEAAEVGDTKVWLLEPERILPLTEGGIPEPGVSPRHVLGTREPELRTRRMSVPLATGTGHRVLALVTDGAHALLTAATGALPLELGKWRLERVGRDDASLLLVGGPP